VQEEYTVTERGRNADPNSPFYRERWLLCSSEEQRMLAFCSDQDISVLHQSMDYIMDGTFKAAPNGFMQLYTVHGWGEFQFEAMPACHALLQSKTVDTYAFLLSKIRQKLVDNHANIGRVQRIHVDYEQAAHSAIAQVFPEVSIKRCNFHFSKCLNLKLQDLGMRDIWSDPGIIGEWVGCLKSLAMLPVDLVIPAYQSILRNPPLVPGND